MKKFFLIIMIFTVLLLVSSCKTENKATKSYINSPSPSPIYKKISETEKTYNVNYFDDIPNLYIEYDNQSYLAIQGTISWYVDIDGKSHGFEADALPPDELIERNNSTIEINKDTSIKLMFDRTPTYYELKIYNPKTSELSGTISTENSYIFISKNQSFTIYTVLAKFDFVSRNAHNSGSVHYIFAVN